MYIEGYSPLQCSSFISLTIDYYCGHSFFTWNVLEIRAWRNSQDNYPYFSADSLKLNKKAVSDTWTIFFFARYYLVNVTTKRYSCEYPITKCNFTRERKLRKLSTDAILTCLWNKLFFVMIIFHVFWQYFDYFWKLFSPRNNCNQHVSISAER